MDYLNDIMLTTLAWIDAREQEDIQIKECMDMIAQLNTTIKLLTEAIAQKNQALADMQKQFDEMMEELKLLQKELLGR